MVDEVQAVFAKTDGKAKRKNSNVATLSTSKWRWERLKSMSKLTLRAMMPLRL